MGLFFEKAPDPTITSLLAQARAQQPPATEQEAAQRAGEMLSTLPVAQQLRAALMAQPADPAQAQAASKSAAAVLPATGTTFNAGRFVIALGIFVALIVGGAVSDAANMTASSAAFFSFAGSVFGVVTAFLGAEKGSSAS